MAVIEINQKKLKEASDELKRKFPQINEILFPVKIQSSEEEYKRIDSLVLSSGIKLLRKSVNETLEEVEKRKKRANNNISCIISQREYDVLKENAEEVYSNNSKQMKEIKKLKKRVC